MKECSSISSNIISFKGRSASDHEARVRATEKMRERRYAAIDAALEKTPRMMLERDRRIVARQLHDLLEEFQKRTGRKKEEVLRAANVGGSGDSTKQLYNYTLPPEGETEKRISKLVQHTHKYRLIAEKAAEIARWNSKKTLIELFQGSSYDGSQALPELPEYLFSMCDILDKMKTWVVRNSNIEWYFETLRKHPVVDEWGNFIVDRHTGAEWSLLQSERYPSLYPFEWLTEYGKAIPGIPLYRTEDSEFPIEFAFDDDFVGGGDGPPDGVFEQGVFRRVFEVRLGLGPVGASGKIDLVFDQRRFDEIWVGEELRCNVKFHFIPASLRQHITVTRTSPPPLWDSEIDTYKFFDGPVGVYSSAELEKFGGGPDCWMRHEPLDDESIPAHELTDDIEPSAPKSLDEFNDWGHAVAQLIEAVDPKTCRKYLGRQESLRCGGGIPALTESPWGTVAAQIEANLYSGDEENRIDTLLMKEVRHHCAMLKECLERRRGLLDENKYRLYVRYGINDEDQ